MSSTFEKEFEDIMSHVERCISNILLSGDRTSKHEPYTWLDEEEDEHLHKAQRHILTHQIIRDGYSYSDSEEHLENAICRLAMAIARRRMKSIDWDEK